MKQQLTMSDKKLRKVSVDLNPVQMVWLHSQHLFQKIEESSFLSQTEIKFYKNNNGVEIRFQGIEGEPQQLHKARQQLQRVIDSNEIRLINTSLHKDIYIRISKQARKEFPKSYIIFLHYQTFQNCCRKLQQKFNITSITTQLDRLRKTNPNFCFLIAEKEKIDDIEKFTNRILHSEVSCASTTFSHRREPLSSPAYKRTMSVSSLKGSFSDHQQQYRLSLHPNPVEEQLFQMSQSVLSKLTAVQMERVRSRNLYEGSRVFCERYEGPYNIMTRKLYYVNRLQLTANPYMQPIYAYSMQQRTPYLWTLNLVTDKNYHRLSEVVETQWICNSRNKVEVLLKTARALVILHNNLQTYSGLSLDTILLDENHNVALSSVIQKQIPPHTNAFVYDIRRYLLLIYRLFTQVELTYEQIVFKQQNKQYFCTISHKSKNLLTRQFLDLADKLFIGEVDLHSFIDSCQKLKQG